jgi:hypothetical protein
MRFTQLAQVIPTTGRVSCASVPEGATVEVTPTDGSRVEGGACIGFRILQGSI